MAQIDFSLRIDKYDAFKLLPRFYQELDIAIGGGGARMLTEAWNEEWFALYDLINGIVSPAHDSWYAGPNTLPYLADLLNAPDLTAFAAAARNFLVWCWPAIRAEKGVTRSVVTVAALLGFKVNVKTLWSAFALPNPTNLADTVNDPYLAYAPAFPLAPSGVLNQAAFALRQQNGLWVLANQDPSGATIKSLSGGETTILLFNHPPFTLPTLGFTLFFPDRLEPYYVAAAAPITLTDPNGQPTDGVTLRLGHADGSPFPLSTVAGSIIHPGAELPIFDPTIIYPSSFYDFEVIVDHDVLDPTAIVAGFTAKLKVLTDSVIPIRDRLRRILSAYQASATATASCPGGLYGAPVTAWGSYVSPYSYADAEAKALAAARANAEAALVCVPEPPLVRITGIEPLAYTAFYSTATFTAYCPAGYYGPPNTITVTRSSTISQADADALAFEAARGLAEAGLKCTLNAPPVVSFPDITPTYSAKATYTAACAVGQLGKPVTVVGSGLSLTSYASAEAAALAGAASAANAALVCTPSALPTIIVEDFLYTLAVGVTVTETCPAGTQGIPQTVSQLYTFQSRGEFKPTFDNAITLATAAATSTASAALRCVSNVGPTISFDPPIQLYAATATATASCPSGLNIQTGNVVTATYTGTDPGSYAAAYATAGSGAASTATAALNCTPPPFNPDSLILTAKDEFGYDPVLRYDHNSKPYNSGHDYYANHIPLASARSDFTRFLAVDAPLLRAQGITQIILAVDWFTPLNNQAVIAPYMSVDFASRVQYPPTTGNDSWTVAGFNPNTTQTLPSAAYRGGTPSDTSIQAAISALAAAGFRVGISPIVQFIDNVNGVLVDRATVNFDATSAGVFAGWLAGYATFFTNYIHLFQAAGVAPSVFYLGNGYRGLTNTSNLANRRLFLQQLLAEATQIHAAFPAALLPYAARNDEYGWNVGLNDFPLDGLWNAPLITLGVNWFEPSAIVTTTTWNKAQVGASSGEDMYYIYPTSALPESNRFLNTTDHAGKANVSTSTPIYPGIGSKNLGNYLSTANWHYGPTPSGYAAGCTVLAGNSVGDAYSLGGLTLSGSAFLESRFNWFAPRSYGVLPRPTSNWLTALNVAGGGYATARLPDPFAAGTVSNVTVEIDFKPDYGGAPPTTFFPGVAAVYDGGFRVEYDGGYRQVRTQIVMAAGPNFISPGVFADDGSITQYHVQWAYAPSGAGSAWMVTEGYYQGGQLVTNTVPLGGTPFLGPSPKKTLSLGSRDISGTSPFTGSLYRFSLDAISSIDSTVHYGGVYYFDEAYAGTRTGYVAENVPAMCTEFGVPSVTGGLVEPRTELTPVPVNPVNYTLGNSTLYSTPDTGNQNLIIAQSASLSVGGVLSSLNLYLAQTSGSFVLGLYDATGPHNGPGQLITQTASVTPGGAAGWYSGTLPAPLYIPAGSYWIAYNSSTNTLATVTQATTGSYVYVGYPFGPLPATYPATTLGGVGGWSFYGTVVNGGTVALPGWMDAAERAYFTSVLNAGYTFSDLRGPYGSTFKRDPLGQLYGLAANLAALRAAGITRNLVAREWDVRSAAAFAATSGGAYCYSDGPMWPFRRVMNGKLIWGGGGSDPTPAPAIVQGPKVNPADPTTKTTISVTFDAPVTAGSTLIATVGWGSSAPNSITNVHDNLNGNWTAAGALEQGNLGSAAIYYFNNSLGGSVTVTVTIAAAMGWLELSVLEVAGLKSGIVDSYAANTHGSPDTTASPGNLITTTANDFLIAFCVAATYVQSGTAGWNFTYFSNSGNGHETLVAATAGTYTPTFTMGGFNYASVAAAFKP